jgi:carboxymethylenebutenolidase
MASSDLTIDTPDGPMGLYEATPEGTARGAVVVIQEAFGVNDHIKDVTRRFADAGFHAVAPDLFHRSGGGSFDYNDFAAVRTHFAGLDDEKILADVDSALDHLRGTEPDRPSSEERTGPAWSDEQIGLVGFCIGGRISFLVAAHRAIGAAVGFYGGGIVTARFPQFPPLADLSPTLATPWLGLFGDLDESIPVDDVEALRTLLAAAPVDTEIVRYPDAEHGFHCDARPSFHEASAKDGWERTLAWFDRHLA